MPHIILRLPYYVACFMRNPSPDISLKATEAYKFSQYSDEYCLMAHALVMQNCAEHISSPCFSEQAWQRMRNGYGIGRNFSSSPLSEPVADSDTLSDSDVMALAGVSFGCREGFGDYLRIAIPKEIVADGRIVRTNKTFFLPRSAASQMSSMLKRRFRRGMMEYMRGDGRYCELHRVRRSVMERLSRFMTKYDIPYSPDRNEVVLLKRLYYRWREREDFTAEEEMEFGYGFTPPRCLNKVKNNTFSAIFLTLAPKSSFWGVFLVSPMTSERVFSSWFSLFFSSSGKRGGKVFILSH